MERKGAKEKGFAGLFFMLGVMALYVVVFFLNEQLGRDALDHAGNLLSRLAPVLALVFVLIFLTNLLIRPAWVRTHVGQHSGLKGWAVALVGGMLSVGPVYPWYALLGELKDKGMRPALVAVFLYSRAIKLPLLPLMIHYFGLAYTLLLIAYLLLFSLLNGMAMKRLEST
ncbi:MAG: permease [Gammaproteobacteria bacterium]|jgi:hypothetical protein